MMKNSSHSGAAKWGILTVNLLLVVVLTGLFFVYNQTYQEKVRQQNLINIDNLNRSAGDLATKYFASRQGSLKNYAQYLSRRTMTMDETVNFLVDMNADENGVYELIGPDYTGYYIQNGLKDDFLTVSYQNKQYRALQDIVKTASSQGVGTVGFLPEFTDDITAKKCFGQYTYIPVLQDGKRTYATLMMVSYSADFISMIQVNGNFSSMANVLFDREGDYIIGNPAYKSGNFFRYLYATNNLTLDERQEIAQQVLSTDSGVLFYRSAQQKDSVFTYRALEGGQWYLVSCVPLEDFEEQHNNRLFTVMLVAGVLLIFLVDVLWLSGLNRQLKTSMEKERRANNAKTEFLSRMSHDIRTPLNAVIGFSELAISEETLSEGAANSLKKINSSGKYLLGLINDILDMTKIESSKIELHENLVEVQSFLDDISGMFSDQARRKGVTLITDFSLNSISWVYMDKLRTRQIYSNLLNNAIKFSDSGTSITWSIREGKTENGSAEVISIIEDQGCGMSEKFMQTIFQPFSQEHNSHSDNEGGTGLGLSIVKSFVELMGGTVKVRSKLGQGSRFTITLHWRLGTPGEMGKKQQTLDANLEILPGKRVLLCEDHPLNREIAIRLLQRQNILVDTAENGRVGLEMFTNAPPGYYDAILMDIQMPVMNGLETTRALRACGREDAASIPIIAMTANAFADDVSNCRKAGMDDHIAKPVEPKKFYEILAAYLQRAEEQKEL